MMSLVVSFLLLHPVASYNVGVAATFLFFVHSTFCLHNWLGLNVALPWFQSLLYRCINMTVKLADFHDLDLLQSLDTIPLKNK